jgi:acetate---CoA ligase (ADP-forming)
MTALAELGVFSDPTSVAVVGASEDPAKWGYWLASGALLGAHRRGVHFVNARATSVLGHPCAPSVSALVEGPDLVALCVPAIHVDAVVDEALDCGVRGFLGITAGIADDAALAAKITDGGARLVGTNSLGIYDAATDLQLMWGTMTPGPLAIVSQSGQLGSEIAAIGLRHGLGVSRFISVGNQTDVTATEFLADLAGHDATGVIALYLESFTDGAALFETLAALRSCGKPTVLLTVGASNASARLVRTHTGSLTSPTDVMDAACRAAGVVRVNTPDQVIDAARALLTAPLPAGRTVAVVGDSGGQCGIAADVAVAAGLTVPHFPASLCELLETQLPPGATCTNPVDLAGAGERDLPNYAAVVERVIAGGEVDAVVMTGYFGCYGQDIPSLSDAES